MRLEDVTKQYTTPLGAPAFPKGIYQFKNREYLNIVYRGDLDPLREIVPEPLEIDEPLVRFEVIRQLDGERMDLESECVDGVVCRWGYMLMADPGAAFDETYRIMRPGGTLALSVFGAPDRNPWASLVGRVLVAERHIPPPVPGSPGIFALSNPKRIHELVTRAGFASPDVAERPLTWRFPTPDAYWWLLTEMAGAISPILRGLAPEAQAKVRTRLDEMAPPFRAGDGYAFPVLCLTVATRKPA
jgi:SAM-dependent methyltransferase